LTTDSQAAFEQELNSLLALQPATICLDCSEIEHVTSSHIKVLWQSRAAAHETGATVRLTSVAIALKRVLEVLDLYSLFETDTPTAELDLATAAMPDLKQPSTVLHVEFEAEAGRINTVLARFRDFLRELDIPRMCAIELETIFYEVATNICLHGQVNKGHLVSLMAIPRSDRITLRFVDRGRPFDPTAPRPAFRPDAAIRDRQNRGLGLTIITRMANRVHYNRQDGQFNVLTIEKNWS
jgi:anti-sigma regulatory factor (Ser/Thr protein kinase)/anti-anti-sigma regulatory factor